MKSTLPRLSLSVLLALFLSAAAGRPAAAQQKSVKPGINKAYQNPNAEQAVKRFENERREIFRKREEIVKACQLKPGMDVADVGAGTGLFTRLFAPKVGPRGKVYAVDIAKNFIDYIEKTCKEQDIKNVQGVVCTPQSTKLAPDSVDLVFVCDTYHHFEFPQKTLASIHRALRPGGRLIIVDFKKKKGKSSERTMKHVRATEKQVIQETADAGFELIDTPKLMQAQYMLRLKK
jgi:ubiquinone/menaquinone biosynthesis C-methylase UbiE